MGNYVDTTLLCIGNDRVELKIDKETGFIADIYNKETDIHHKDGEKSGVWPLGMRLGTLNATNLVRAEINAHPQAAKQKMKYTTRDEDGETILEMVYDNLMSTGGGPTGVALKVTVTLRDGADYFLIRAHIENNGKYDITKIYSGWGGLVADDTREGETLAVPDWSHGTKRRNPHKTFPERCTFGYPIMGSEGRMNAGWLDLYGEKGGVGIGYLNKQGLSMLFGVQRQGGGTGINWQLLDLRYDTAADDWFAVGDTYPVRKGESFTTDPWILAPHAGDWHRMADIYRTEYEITFKDDHLTWESTHEVAKQVDLIASWGWKACDKDSFAEIPAMAKQYMDTVGVSPENFMLPIVAFNHIPLRFPDHFPNHAKEGAPEACKSTVDKLRHMGIEAIPFFTHYYYTHREAIDYDEKSDTGYDHGNVLWGQIGNIACLDTDEWQKLWREKYIPGFDSVGASGVLLDEGEDQYIVCPHPSHRHGDTAVGMLGAHVRGAREIIQAFRDGFKNRRPFFVTEWAGDLVTRSVDVWSGFAGVPGDKMLFPPIVRKVEGWTIEREIFRYTWPYRLNTDSGFKRDYTVDWINRTLVNGIILGGYLSLSITQKIPADLLEAVRQFVRVRRELREQKAPGFPQGFKDVIGLTADSPDLVARIYCDDTGMTVLYYAKEDVETFVTVNPENLGFSGKSEQSFKVSLEKDEAGFHIVE